MLDNKTRQKILSQDKWTARQIMLAGFITNNRNSKRSYDFILSQIQRGRLIGENTNFGGVIPRYIVSTPNLLAYIANIGLPKA